MLGRKDRWQEDLFMVGTLGDLVPEDHPLRQIDRVLDLSWLREEVRDLYCADNGRPSLDPEVAMRLEIAGVVEGITKSRALMRQAQVNVAIRWFVGYRLHEALPDHSSLSVTRRRWGRERFRRLLERTIRQCLDAGLVGGKTLHVDATLIRADVSWDSLIRQHVEEASADAGTDGGPDDEGPPPKRKGRPATRPPKTKRVSRTDPEATMATSSREFHLQPTYKQHTAVDDQAGIIVDVEVTTGEVSEGKELCDVIDRVETVLETQIETVTADAGYAHGANYEALEGRQIVAVIPPPRPSRRKSRTIPSQRFKYDANADVVRCPRGRTLHPSSRTEHGRSYRARRKDCKTCRLAGRCLSKTATVRTVHIGHGYVALLRARREHLRGWSDEKRNLYTRHRWQVEGVHGEGKAVHGLHRAARRGTANVQIQSYLTAAVINLKRLAKYKSTKPSHSGPDRRCRSQIGPSHVVLWPCDTPRQPILTKAA
jgi:transposase